VVLLKETLYFKEALSQLHTYIKRSINKAIKHISIQASGLALRAGTPNRARALNTMPLQNVL